MAPLSQSVPTARSRFATEAAGRDEAPTPWRRGLINAGGYYWPLSTFGSNLRPDFVPASVASAVASMTSCLA